jgi:hypothetical protein
MSRSFLNSGTLIVKIYTITVPVFGEISWQGIISSFFMKKSAKEQVDRNLKL